MFGTGFIEISWLDKKKFRNQSNKEKEDRRLKASNTPPMARVFFRFKHVGVKKGVGDPSKAAELFAFSDMPKPQIFLF